MRREFLKLMKCPYCGNDFRIEEVYEENDKGIINGCIKCECDIYPILEDILILKKDNMKKYIIKLLKDNNIREAVAFSLSEHIEYMCDIMNYLESREHYKINKNLFALVKIRHLLKNRYKKYTDKSLSFCEVMGSSPYEIYLKHRFSTESFWSLYPFVPLLKRNNGRILDLGCGAGHASFVISSYVNPDELVCADHTFKSLYLARKYSAKGSHFICLDANYPLPFNDNIFSSVVMLDAFHYVNAKALLAKECERVLNQEGMLLLLHLHSALSEDISFEEQLSPSTWVSLFNNLKAIAMPEKSIVEDFILRYRLDLSKKYTEHELNSSEAILIVAGVDLECLEGVWKDILKIKNNLIINPIYKMKKNGNKILLNREFPSASFRKEYPLVERYLSDKCEIDKIIVNGRSVDISRSNEGEIEDLMRKFVIINVPERFIK